MEFPSAAILPVGAAVGWVPGALPPEEGFRGPLISIVRKLIRNKKSRINRKVRATRPASPSMKGQAAPGVLLRARYQGKIIIHSKNEPRLQRNGVGMFFLRASLYTHAEERTTNPARTNWLFPIPSSP